MISNECWGQLPWQTLSPLDSPGLHSFLSVGEMTRERGRERGEGRSSRRPNTRQI